MRFHVTGCIFAVALLFIPLVAAQPSWADETLFTTQTPAVTNASDGTNANYELGTAFTSDIAGQITAVRFWKAPSETGTHTGRIWSGTGQLLDSVTFTNETASGWQVQPLASPFAITANTTYVVSVNTGGTYYVATDGGLSSQVTNQDLSSVVGNNGLYGPPGAFPTNTHDGANYFRDVVFVAALPLQSGSNCNGVYTGAFNGNLTVTSGQTCALVSASVTGNITLSGGSLAISNSAIGGNLQIQSVPAAPGPSPICGPPPPVPPGPAALPPGPAVPPPGPPAPAPCAGNQVGGSLAINNSAIGGNVQVQGGGIFSIGPSAAIGGNLQIQNIPSGTEQSQICDTTVRGNLQFQNNGAPLLIGAAAPASCAGNRLGGNLTIQNNTAATTVSDNLVTGNLQAQNNSGATIVNGNIVTGNLQDQNNTAATQVFSNIVGNILQCQQNSSITGGGNTAGQKQGQCVAF
jgi:hypothetical protein